MPVLNCINTPAPKGYYYPTIEIDMMSIIYVHITATTHIYFWMVISKNKSKWNASKQINVGMYKPIICEKNIRPFLAMKCLFTYRISWCKLACFREATLACVRTQAVAA